MTRYVKKRPIFANLFLILAVLMFSATRCQTAKVNSTTDTPTSTPAQGTPYFGFNVKGSLSPDIQIDLTDKLLEKLPATTSKNLVLRLPGGTVGMTEGREVWNQDLINKWVSLQQKHGFRFIYMVNGNDSPAGQAVIIKDWLDAGAKFDYLEMMNEYYLPKFRLGKTEKPEVTRKVNGNIYVDEILPSFFSSLDKFNIPYLIIGAPVNVGKNLEALAEWNDVIVEAVNNKYKSKHLGVTIHLYQRDVKEDYDYAQIDRMRSRLPEGTCIAITEMGILDRSIPMSSIGQYTFDHYKKIAQHLGAGDYMLDQVLYNEYKNSRRATLHPAPNGLTPKGQKVMEFFKGN